MSALDLGRARELFSAHQFAQAAEALAPSAASQALDGEGWQLYATALMQDRKTALARAALEQAIALGFDNGAIRLLLSNALLDLGDPHAALGALDAALQRDPAFAEAHNNRGIILAELGRTPDARQAFERAVASKPDYFRAWTNLSGTALQMGDATPALQAAEKAVTHDPRYGLGHLALGRAAMALERFAEAEASLRTAATLLPHSPEPYVALAGLFELRQRAPEAMDVLQRALAIAPRRADLWFMLGNSCAAVDDLSGALQAYARAQAGWPDSLEVESRAALLLPNILVNRAHIDACRARFGQGLDYLAAQLPRLLPSVTPANVSRVLQTNFLLGYHGCNDLEFQKRFGAIAEAAARHALGARLPTPARILDRPRLRIGFCSRRFYESTAGHYFASWITDLDRSRFEVHVYHARTGGDHLTDRIRARADQFFASPGNVPALAERIAGDQLDVLIYPELGMDAAVFMLASLRLAPHQACGWGHPVTSGLPTIDTFLSCAEMEPADAATHYSERLALLPGIGTRYENPARAGIAPATRAEFSLPERAPLLLFPQSLFKIHPDNDDLIVRILSRVPDCVLVMFAGPNPAITGKFVTRLRQAFSRAGLPEAGRIRILPTVSRTDYLRINAVCDAMLDSLHWSGGNTSLDALAMGLPVATLPGAYMRGRQSAAMLRRLGVDELIAADAPALVESTVRLMTDSAWRQSLSQRIVENHQHLFDDPEPVAEFGRFLERAARGD